MYLYLRHSSPANTYSDMDYFILTVNTESYMLSMKGAIINEHTTEHQ
ncbi:hypothetical protein bcere0009_52600 [Bacillus cereus R309803]|nr:hypothetical protein bcere0009_52600 [Bacillus cereus R309803]